jgi:predicted metal-dependent hydrolase
VSPIPPPETPPARRTVAPFPRQRHLPGEPLPEDFPALLDAVGADFDWGCDLFDHRYYWEAHEVWEREWRGLPVGDLERELLQGLICAAAFLVKQHQGVLSGAERLLARAEERLARVGPAGRGIDLVELSRRLHAFREGGPWVTLPPA